jgi:hypothetical protein
LCNPKLTHNYLTEKDGFVIEGKRKAEGENLEENSSAEQYN